MDITNVIVAPWVTEKTHLLKESNAPKLSFVVNTTANKIEIKKAFFIIFGVKAKCVNTLIRKPKPTRYIAKSKKNYSKTFKIAYITVTKENYEILKNSTNYQETNPTLSSKEIKNNNQ